MKTNSGVTTDISRMSYNGSATFVQGYNGVILRSLDKGLTWKKMTSGTSESLFSSYWTSSTTGYVVGQKGTILKSTNNGLSWSKMTPVTSHQLISVVFTDAMHGYASGGTGGANIVP
ncbi:unnamed protein product [marine sediment metagenome]|uniref:Photosynthesis system II assembly factor Ycf48/Hcf136-like domain-containing protein n=1 Tax=marine sediment metagenome TaxID=412755 RepID=X1EGE6_9ZZZZ